MNEHVERNRNEWNRWADNWVEPGRRDWSRSEIVWGNLEARESDLGLLRDVVTKDILELGCGTAYFSSWLARRGARPVGLDLSERQLETARLLQNEYGLVFPLVHANAEQVPMRSGTFDLVLSEYGASIWADPYAWVPEASRLLRPGGELIFLVSGTIAVLCMPDEEKEIPVVDRLLRPYFGMHQFQWKSDDSVDFHLGYGAWIGLLRANGFEIEALVELQAPPDMTQTRLNPSLWLDPEWARKWPAEEIWKARKRS